MGLCRAAFAALLITVLTITVLARQDNAEISTAQQDAIDRAHEGIFRDTDNAVEAGRLTEALSNVLPHTGSSSAVSRGNYIDEHVFGRMERDGVPHAPLAADEEFVRRVYLDATGLLPEPERVREFLASDDPAKRDKLIDSLIGTEEFAEQWAWFWSDITQIRNDSFPYWFKQALKLDRPYNETAREMLSPGSSKVGFSNPLWGVTQASTRNATRSVVSTDPDNYFVLNRLDFLDNLAVSFGRTFLGINMDCISCHDGARRLDSINLYLASRTRAEFHQQAAFWGHLNVVPSGMSTGNSVQNDDNPGYRTGDDAPYHTASENRFPRDGKTYEPAFILTGERPQPGADPRKELARLMTSHVQFSRATVNLIWGKLMTVGFVEPYDGFDLLRLDPDNPPPAPWTLQPTNPWLLEDMAKDFRESNYSLHHLFKSIMKSSAYQLSTYFPGEWRDEYAPYYARRFARVMTGPEVADNLARATGLSYDFSWVGEGVTRVKQLTDPSQVNPPNTLRLGGVNDLGGGGTLEGNSMLAIMQSFFQSTRETPALLLNRPTAVQAMLVMTSPTVTDRVMARPGSRLHGLLNSGKNDTEIVEEIFLATLSRPPKAAETEVALRILQEGDRVQLAEDIQWALLNSVEFLLNH